MLCRRTFYGAARRSGRGCFAADRAGALVFVGGGPPDRQDDLEHLSQTLNAEGRYRVLMVDLQTARDQADIAQAMKILLRRLQTTMESEAPTLVQPEENIERWLQVPEEALVGYLSAAVAASDKPVVILFDEADVLRGPAMVSFLTQLRSLYLARKKRPAPHSVVLTGVRSVRDYVANAQNQVTWLGSASPFNITVENVTLAALPRPRSRTSPPNTPPRPGKFLRPEAHEIENLLLDFGGLASLGPNYNRRSRTAEDLEARAHQRAKDGLWWMAARATIADMRLEITNDFPNHPKLGSPALTKAAAQQYLEQHLLHSAWGVRIQSTAQGLGVAWIARHLQQHETALSTPLSDGSWRWQWSGKELFADVAGYMECPAPDLAKGLAEHQRTQGTVEPVMVALRSALRKRTGLDRW